MGPLKLNFMIMKFITSLCVEVAQCVERTPSCQEVIGSNFDPAAPFPTGWAGVNLTGPAETKTMIYTE